MRSTLLGGFSSTGRTSQQLIQTSLAWRSTFSLPLVSNQFLLLLQSCSPTEPSASSVDAERAFSGGRLQVNHLQHGTNSQTFRAQMAVGSWVGSDIFPTLEPFEKIIESVSSRSGKVKVKAKVKAVVHDDKGKLRAAVQESDDDTDFEWQGEDGYD